MTTKPKPKHATREAWLLAALPTLRAWLTEAGAPSFPDPLVSVGLPSRGAFSARRRRIGECWTEKASKSEKRCTIFLSPTLDSPTKMLDVFAHELIHAAVGVKAGHGKPFRAVAVALGLEGPMRATHAGTALAAKLDKLSTDLGEFPHDPLTRFRDPSKKQKCRQRKYVCSDSECGQIMRAASDSLIALHQHDDGSRHTFVLADLPDAPPTRGNPDNDPDDV